MTTDSDPLYERLRAADPAADLDDRDLDPSGRLAAHLRSRVLRATAAGGSRRRRGQMVAAFAALLLLISGGAVAAGLFQPDPQDVATILEHARGAYETAPLGGGEMPVLLSTSTVWCAYEDGTVGPNSWHDLALDEEMTERHLAEACLEGTDLTRFGQEPAPTVDEVTLCEAVVPAHELRRRLGEELAQPILEGDPDGDRPAFPLVLGWEADCSETALRTDPDIELRPLRSLPAINKAREVEIWLQAAGWSDCLTLEETHRLASRARAELDNDWIVTDGTAHMDTDGIACYSGVRVDALWGILSVAGHGG